MEMLTIWMLGWEDPIASGGEPEAWQPVARSLGSQVKLNVLLPHNDPPVTLENVTITDLDTVDLPLRPRTAMPPENLPFAPIPFPPPTIPLYGTPVYTGKETGKPGQRLPGEAVRTGHYNQPVTIAASHKTAAPTPPASLHAQVIEYARKVSRFAHGQNFDGIFAFHWQTYLAALELKLVAGKKMVLQVHALSQDRHFPDRLAWMLEIEKQAVEKTDAILVDNDQLAGSLKKEYGFAADKLSVSDRPEKTPEMLLRVFSHQPFGLADGKDPPDQEHPRETKAVTTTKA
jgi:glycogen synthase